MYILLMPPALQTQPSRSVTNMDIQKYLDLPEIFEHKVIPASEIPFSQSVADACKANICGRYGTCWTCPPGVGEYRELEKQIKAYEKAAVFTFKYDLEDSFDFEGMMDGQRTTMEILQRITDRLRADGEVFWALGCEGCHLCPKCTYPDAPCRFPEKAIKSVEACGINVVELAKNIGIHYHNGANTVTYFAIILF